MSTESPIEEDMLNAFQSIGHNIVVMERASLIEIKQKAAPGTVIVATQVKLGPYRADFVLAGYRDLNDMHILCVECDGKAWHTGIEALMRDMDRDEFMRSVGVNVMRFTGAAIHRDMYRCARQAVGEVSGCHGRDTAPGFAGAISNVVENFTRRMTGERT